MVDDSLDNINNEWGTEMNKLCFNNKLKSELPTFCTDFFLYSYINYNYNLVSGYIISQQETIKYLKNTITIDDNLNKIIIESENSLHYPIIYINQIEQYYPEITKELETKMLAHLLLNRQLTYLIDLKKNGEISKKYFNFKNKIRYIILNSYNYFYSLKSVRFFLSFRLFFSNL